MTVVLEHYTSGSGYNAEISREKNSVLYTLVISEPVKDNPGFATTLLKRDYISIYSARNALRKHGNFKRIMGGK